MLLLASLLLVPSLDALWAQGSFLRGDCDQSQQLDITDSIRLLGYLFLGHDDPTCFDACDVNDDEELNITDAISGLGFLFLGAAPPLPPYPFEGVDPAGIDLDCQNGRSPLVDVSIVPGTLVFHSLNHAERVIVRATYDSGETKILGPKDEVIYTSDDAAIAEVDASGAVTSKGVGSTILRASFQGVEGRGEVRVAAGADGSPVIRWTSPSPGALVSTPTVVVSGWVSDASAELTIETDGEVRELAVDAVGSHSFSAEIGLSLGPNDIIVRARNASGTSDATLNVVRFDGNDADALAADGRRFPHVPTRFLSEPDTTPPRLEVSAPRNGSRFASGHVDVMGTVDDPAAEVRVHGIPVRVSDGEFRLEALQLAAGEQNIEIVATDSLGNEARRSIAVIIDATRPVISIEQPVDAPILIVSQLDFELRGRVQPQGSRVWVNGVEAVMAGSAFSMSLDLEDGWNDLVVRAASGDAVTQIVRSVIVDQVAPIIQIDYPPIEDLASAQGFRSPDEIVDLVGRVVDPGLPEHLTRANPVRLIVDGEEREVHRSFRIPIRISPGRSQIELQALDGRGNVTRIDLHFDRGETAARISILGGESQSTTIGELYPESLEVRAQDNLGTPLSSVPLTFRVLRGSGEFAGGRREIEILSSAAGVASLEFRCGREAGNGTQLVEVRLPATNAAPLVYSLDAEVSAGRVLVARGSRRRRGARGRGLSRPLEVRLLDDAGNPVSGTPARFRFIEGSGGFPGGSDVEVTTNGSGIASLPVGLGIQQVGVARVEVSSPGAGPIHFELRGMIAGAAADTQISGRVLDDWNRPIIGAEVRWLHGGEMGITDGSGRFELSGVPFGEILLEVDAGPSHGSDRFLVHAVSGRRNLIDHPLRLVDLERSGGKLRVSPSAGGVLTLPSLPGFRLEIPAGGVTFPDGSASGVISGVHLNLRGAAEALPDDTSVDILVAIHPFAARFSRDVRLRLPSVGSMRGGELTLFHRRASSGGFVDTGPVIVQESGLDLIPEPAAMSSGGLYFAARPGPAGSQTAVVTGEVEVLVPSHSDAPQRDESAVVGYQVYAHSGEFFLGEVDLVIRSRGFDYRLARRYESRHLFRGSLGWNWQHEYSDRRIYSGLVGGNIVRADGCGDLDVYYFDSASGRFISPLGKYSRLFLDADGIFIERFPDGMTYRYQPLDNSALSGRLLSISDRRGNTMEMLWRSDGRLDAVRDTLGRLVQYSYDANGRILRVSDFADRFVTFEYDARGDLVAVTGPPVQGTLTSNNYPDGKRVEYSYSFGFSDRRLNHNLLTIIDPREVAAGTAVPRITNVYETDSAAPAFDRVVSQIWGGVNATRIPAGGALEIVYMPTPGISFDPLLDASGLAAHLTAEAGATRVINRLGEERVVTWNGAGLPLSDSVLTVDDDGPRDASRQVPEVGTQPAVHVTRHRWSSGGLLEMKWLPDASRIEYEYDVDAPLRSSRAGWIERRRYPSPFATGGPGGLEGTADPEVTHRVFDPIFDRLVSETRADGGTRHWVLDYQESADVQTLADLLGVAPDDVALALNRSGIDLGLGDVNGDGREDAAFGNCLREELPLVTLPDGSTQNAERLYSYNDFGQLASVEDATGTVERYEYYPESDPDGDGTPSLPGNEGAEGKRDSETGGYLSHHVQDAESDEQRDAILATTMYRYDPLGRAVEIVDPNGNVVMLTYNELDQLIEYRLPNPLKYRRWFFYDADDHLSKVWVENFRASDANVQIFDIDNPWIETRNEYDLLGQLVTRTRELSGGDAGPERQLVENLRYDAEGRLLRRGLGEPGDETGVEAWEYDVRGLQIAKISGPGSEAEATIRKYYDAGERLVREVDAADSDGDGDAEATDYLYDGFGRHIATIDAAGGATVFDRDSAGRVVLESRVGSVGGPGSSSGPGGQSAELLARRGFDYDERGRLRGSFEALFGSGMKARDLWTRLTRDAEGRVIREERPEGVTLIERDALGRVVEKRLPSGSVLRSEYDANGNLIQEERTHVADFVIDKSLAADPDYDDEGRLLRVRKFLHVYDGLNRRVASVDPSGGTWRARHDSLDRLVMVSDSLGVITGSDVHSELDSIRDRLGDEQADRVNGHGNRKRYFYDNIGRPVRVDHEMRRGGTGAGELDTTNAFDLDGQASIRFEWTDAGQLAAWRDDALNATQYTYDEAGGLLRKTWPDGSFESFELDRDGLPTRITRRGGVVIVQRYDALHRLIDRRIESEGGGPVAGTSWQRFEYDGLGRLGSAFDGNDPDDPEDDAQVLRYYDSTGALTLECQGPFSFAYARDDQGRAVNTIYPDATRLSRIWTPGHAVRSVDVDGENIVSYDRMSDGLLMASQKRSGITLSYLLPGEDDVLRLSGYDRLDRIIDHSYLNAEGELLLGFEYGRNSVGLPLYERFLHRNKAPGDVWEYDSLYRVRRYIPEVFEPRVPPVNPVRKLEFVRDARHNWRVVEVDQGIQFFDVDALNRYTEVDTEIPEYDARGNLTALSGWSFAYDGLDRLILVMQRDVEVARYSYDAFGTEQPFDFSGAGRRVRKSVLRPTTQQPGGEIRFTYSETGIGEERDGNGNPLRQFLRGDGGRIERLLYHDAGQRRALDVLRDARGGVVGLVDARGALVEQYRYGLHGEPKILNEFGNPRSFSRFGHALLSGEQAWDFESGLASVGAAHFHPGLGRFLSAHAKLYPSGPLSVNAYTGDGLPGMPGAVHGDGRDLHRFEELEPFRRAAMSALPAGSLGSRVLGVAPAARPGLPIQKKIADLLKIPGEESAAP